MFDFFTMYEDYVGDYNVGDNEDDQDAAVNLQINWMDHNILPPWSSCATMFSSLSLDVVFSSV